MNIFKRITEKDPGRKGSKSVFDADAKPKLIKDWSFEGFVNVDAAISPDGHLAAASGDGSTIEIWKLPSGDSARKLQGHDRNVICIGFSPDSGRLLSGSENGEVRLWDVNDRRCLNVLRGHTGRVSAVAFFQNGDTALSTSWDESLRVWDVRSGNCRSVLSGHRGKVTAVAVSPDGRYAVSTALNSTVMVWDLASGKPPESLPGHQGKVVCVAISGDGRHVLSGASDGRLMISDLPPTKLRTKGPLPSSVSNVLGSKDGMKWVLSLDNGAALLLDEKSEKATVLFEVSGRMQAGIPLSTAISLSADSRRLLVGRAGTLGLFEFE
jgi:WD40 repeat protein